ncbi:CarD family transcriptional regulator [Bacillus sp. DTU_2020_1000418_1_SI_GHA_SEK_038]|uniref:CarD family transcriptional regulator n=1 Tax=Bacillus sp. DTU_2020_1000418_1_SI_GHA_SEK_038 TaxID=3077585 RepID=UPI0028E304CC|nr:CarD family transcriptional regulator [Bacillus sp. DTU_2020_1000418_1_SI_GHA_SEK_038]WNS75238.1 CarD family transcriptional regulator [Bacillus sp. DTU_2020_1000418_1_SI_GHA_SEK_038]
MFQIGDKVFYPMHGAGIIEAIEEREILGKTQEYCVIHIPLNKMDVMLPLKTMSESGVRSIIDGEAMKEILFDLHNVDSDCSLPWKERYKSNMEKLKSGRVEDSAEIVRDLLHRNKEKSLNTSERQLLNQAQRNIISELSLIKDISENEAAELLKYSS